MPNPWEVFWLFFNYRAPGAGSGRSAQTTSIPSTTVPAPGKLTNYLVLKTNGLEIGRASGEKDQVILKTWANPKAAFGQKETLKIRRMGTRLTVQLNADPSLLYDFGRDKEKPFDDGGAIGLYTEDADVLIESLHVREI